MGALSIFRRLNLFIPLGDAGQDGNPNDLKCLCQQKTHTQKTPWDRQRSGAGNCPLRASGNMEKQGDPFPFDGHRRMGKAPRTTRQSAHQVNDTPGKQQFP